MSKNRTIVGNNKGKSRNYWNREEKTTRKKEKREEAPMYKRRNDNREITIEKEETS